MNNSDHPFRNDKDVPKCEKRSCKKCNRRAHLIAARRGLRRATMMARAWKPQAWALLFYLMTVGNLSAGLYFAHPDHDGYLQALIWGSLSYIIFSIICYVNKDADYDPTPERVVKFAIPLFGYSLFFPFVVGTIHLWTL